MKKFILIITAFFLFQQTVLSGTIYQLYDCPSMSRYNLSVKTPEKGCKFAETYGMTKDECIKSLKQEYSAVTKELSSGKCKPNGYHIEGSYNDTYCSIQFVTSPSPKVLSQSYSNAKGMGYNGGNDVNGTKCIDKLYKELLVKYPNMQK